MREGCGPLGQPEASFSTQKQVEVSVAKYRMLNGGTTCLRAVSFSGKTSQILPPPIFNINFWAKKPQQNTPPRTGHPAQGTPPAQVPPAQAHPLAQATCARHPPCAGPPAQVPPPALVPPAHGSPSKGPFSYEYFGRGNPSPRTETHQHRPHTPDKFYH